MTALWLRTTLRKQLLGHPRAMPGVWGRFALHRILPRKEFMGRAFEYTYRSMPFACASGLLQATPAASFAFSTAIAAVLMLSAEFPTSPPRMTSPHPENAVN